MVSHRLPPSRTPAGVYITCSDLSAPSFPSLPWPETEEMCRWKKCPRTHWALTKARTSDSYLPRGREKRYRRVRAKGWWTYSYAPVSFRSLTLTSFTWIFESGSTCVGVSKVTTDRWCQKIYTEVLAHSLQQLRLFVYYMSFSSSYHYLCHDDHSVFHNQLQYLYPIMFDHMSLTHCCTVQNIKLLLIHGWWLHCAKQ